MLSFCMNLFIVPIKNYTGLPLVNLYWIPIGNLVYVLAIIDHLYCMTSFFIGTIKSFFWKAQPLQDNLRSCTVAVQKNTNFSSITSKPIIIRWIGTGSQPQRKIMHSIIFTNKHHKIINSPGFWSLEVNKTGFNCIILHFNIRGKLSIKRCYNNYSLYQISSLFLFFQILD